MEFGSLEDFERWNRAVKRSKERRDKEYWGNPENMWENEDRTPLSVVQDILDWKEY